MGEVVLFEEALARQRFSGITAVALACTVAAVVQYGQWLWQGTVAVWQWYGHGHGSGRAQVLEWLRTWFNGSYRTGIDKQPQLGATVMLQVRCVAVARSNCKPPVS